MPGKVFRESGRRLLHGHGKYRRNLNASLVLLSFCCWRPLRTGFDQGRQSYDFGAVIGPHSQWQKCPFFPIYHSKFPKIVQYEKSRLSVCSFSWTCLLAIYLSLNYCFLLTVCSTSNTNNLINIHKNVKLMKKVFSTICGFFPIYPKI